MQQAGKHGYKSLDAQQYGISGPELSTSSIGVFEWVLKVDGKGCKPGKAKVRIIGRSYQPDLINRAAERVAQELDAGTYSGPKTVRL